MIRAYLLGERSHLSKCRALLHTRFVYVLDRFQCHYGSMHHHLFKGNLPVMVRSRSESWYVCDLASYGGCCSDVHVLSAGTFLNGTIMTQIFYYKGGKSSVTKRKTKAQ